MSETARYRRKPEPSITAHGPISGAELFDGMLSTDSTERIWAGDYIVTYPNGETLPVDPKTFEATYERVTEPLGDEVMARADRYLMLEGGDYETYRIIRDLVVELERTRDAIRM